jgi:hypothetical protein
MVNRFQQLSLWQYPSSEAFAPFGKENHTAFGEVWGRPARAQARPEAPGNTQRIRRESCKQALARVKANRGSPGMDGMTVRDLPGYLLCRAATTEVLRGASEVWRHRLSASRRFLFLIVFRKPVDRIRPTSKSSTCFSVYRQRERDAHSKDPATELSAHLHRDQ